jgi:hypothetical protein
MSLLAVQGGATGTGTVTLLAPITNTNRTLTLPDVTGTVLTNATTTGFPAGSVLQVVNATYATQTSSSSSTFADTGLTASITPSSVSSKILVLVSQNGCAKSDNNTRLGVRLVRGVTTISTIEDSGGFTGNATPNYFGGISTGYLDSPATTSATTYKTQFNSFSNVATALVQANSATSTITLMEIAG